MLTRSVELAIATKTTDFAGIRMMCIICSLPTLVEDTRRMNASIPGTAPTWGYGKNSLACKNLPKVIGMIVVVLVYSLTCIAGWQSPPTTESHKAAAGPAIESPKLATLSSASCAASHGVDQKLVVLPTPTAASAHDRSAEKTDPNRH